MPVAETLRKKFSTLYIVKVQQIKIHLYSTGRKKDACKANKKEIQLQFFKKSRLDEVPAVSCSVRPALSEFSCSKKENGQDWRMG